MFMQILGILKTKSYPTTQATFQQHNIKSIIMLLPRIFKPSYHLHEVQMKYKNIPEKFEFKYV